MTLICHWSQQTWNLKSPVLWECCAVQWKSTDVSGELIKCNVVDRQQTWAVIKRIRVWDITGVIYMHIFDMCIHLISCSHLFPLQTVFYAWYCAAWQWLYQNMFKFGEKGQYFFYFKLSFLLPLFLVVSFLSTFFFSWEWLPIKDSSEVKRYMPNWCCWWHLCLALCYTCVTRSVHVVCKTADPPPKQWSDKLCVLSVWMFHIQNMCIFHITINILIWM
jgi:hypothetical protein